jgi:hypothetical protein
MGKSETVNFTVETQQQPSRTSTQAIVAVSVAVAAVFAAGAVIALACLKKHKQ